MIRHCLATDIPQVTSIYSHHVIHGTGTFELTPPSEAEMHARHQEVLRRQLPWLVAEKDGDIAGFAYANWFRPRAAFQYCAEDSVYIREKNHRQGIGHALLQALMEQAEKSNIRKMVAVIGDSANTSSIALHQQHGFTHVGIIRAAGWKLNAWRDIVIMEKLLGDAALTPPHGIS